MSVAHSQPDDAHGHDDRPSYLAHHWDTPHQQFDAAKTGMWLFLATELLFFGGLFCVYAVLRGNRPEIFSYGSLFLDTNLGALSSSASP
jgi:cytochrome c oxidase subunit 3